MNTTQNKEDGTKWLFPMTLHHAFDDVFKTWAGALQETCGRKEGLAPAISYAVGTTCSKALSSFPHSGWTSKIWKHALACFHESKIEGWRPIPMKAAHDFAHQVHTACVKEYKLTKSREVIEDRIRAVITETGNKRIDECFEVSDFVPCLAELLYQGRYEGTGRYRTFELQVGGVLSRLYGPVLDAGSNYGSFLEGTMGILKNAPFVKAQADTMTVGEAQDFAGKVHQAFVKAFAAPAP
ncbi:MAG: hypothetical protein AB7S81_02860 [Bdellovibrionales bacterium]